MDKFVLAVETIKIIIDMHTSISNLPPEILEIIFNKLCFKNIISCRKVCVKWKILIQSLILKSNGIFLVVSYNGYEIVDLLNSSAKYELMADKVAEIINTPTNFRSSKFTNSEIETKLLLKGMYGKVKLETEFAVCNGIRYRTKNFKLLRGFPVNLKNKIYASASVALQHQRTLWTVGGRNKSTAQVLSSTDFLKLGQCFTEEGPDLPFTISGHSMINYDEKSLYIIGGIQNNSKSNKTWIVNPTDGFKIREGPSLNEKRFGHQCAKMTINGRTILVVAGGYGKFLRPLDSVEILDPLRENKWNSGPNLPLKLEGPVMVTSPTGKGVIVMGGQTETDKHSKAMFEFSDSMEWTRLKQTLQNNHSCPIAIPIPKPDDLVYEKVQENH